MGVKGLLPGLQESVKASSVGYFKGTRVAIDASGWLHKGLYAAAEDYVDSGRSSAQRPHYSVRRFWEPSYELAYHYRDLASILTTCIHDSC